MAGDAKPPNAELRLYGGAAFERALGEFQEAALMLDFPVGGCGEMDEPLPATWGVGGQDC